MATPEDLALQVRDALFLSASRTYGEQYFEPFLRAKYGLQEPTSGDHDGTDSKGKKYEIKACKVLRATQNRRGSKSLLDRILNENETSVLSRLVPFSDAESAEYDANVQNVKRDHFDVLLYALLFEDCIKVFSARSEQIATGIFKGWSDFHGRYDAPGKSGQFPVNRRNIAWHLERHLLDTVTYGEFAIFLMSE